MRQIQVCLAQCVLFHNNCISLSLTHIVQFYMQKNILEKKSIFSWQIIKFCQIVQCALDRTYSIVIAKYSEEESNDNKALI